MQTVGDLANFNPHLHVLAADWVFGADGTFIAVPTVTEALLAEGFRRAVLEFLTANDALSEDLWAKMLGWRYCGGFSAHDQVRVARDDREYRIKLADYMIRQPTNIDQPGGPRKPHGHHRHHALAARDQLCVRPVRGEQAAGLCQRGGARVFERCGFHVPNDAPYRRDLPTVHFEFSPIEN